MLERYYSFNQYLKENFGERVHRISIDAGFSCPNLDGKISNEGCIFCNNKAFSVYAKENIEHKTYNENFRLENVKEQIIKSIHFYKTKFKIKKFVAYFQSFSNTYADIETLKRTYDIVKEFPEIVGLSISTRPDCVDIEKLKLISEYKKNPQLKIVWLEYGLQTTDDKILSILNRGHTYKDFLTALELTKRFEINVGVHMILGLLGQSYDDIIKDAKTISHLPIDGIKFHILHILKNTKLEQMYNDGKIKLFSQEEYIKTLCDFIEHLPKNVVILRLISTANPRYLVAPKWINNKNGIITKIRQELETRDTFQGKCFK
jgi:radical SAM protein (TIGR01212 family)